MYAETGESTGMEGRERRLGGCRLEGGEGEVADWEEAGRR
jgi:hypothetical protein